MRRSSLGWLLIPAALLAWAADGAPAQQSPFFVRQQADAIIAQRLGQAEMANAVLAARLTEAQQAAAAEQKKAAALAAFWRAYVGRASNPSKTR